jgi:predicted MarR family transcription regulator
MHRLTILTIYKLIEQTFKWQKGTYTITETGREVIIDYGKSKIRERKLIDAITDIQAEVKTLFRLPYAPFISKFGTGKATLYLHS